MAALKDLPGRGVKPTITNDAKSWVLSIARTPPKEPGFANEVWTYRLLIKYIRKTCNEKRHECLGKIGIGMAQSISQTGYHAY